MAKNTNSVQISGNLVADPRVTGEGSKVRTLFTVAVNRTNYDGTPVVGADGKQQANFIDVTAFGPLGRNVAKTFKKGMPVIVSGELNTYSVKATLEGETEAKNIGRMSVTAASAGPDLTWAEATVTRNEQGSNQGNASGGSAASSAPSAGADDF